MANKNKQQAIIIGILAVIAFVALIGPKIGLFSILYPSSITTSGSWDNTKLLRDYSVYPEKNLETSACASSLSYVYIKYTVPSELAEITQPGDVIGRYNVVYSPNGPNSEVTVSCGESTQTSLFRKDVSVEESVFVDVPASCMYYDSINDNYKVRMALFADDLCVADVTFILDECSESETKCSGKDYYTCENKLWSNQGIVVGECGVECLSGDKCEGTDYYVCENNQWVPEGLTIGECGIECLFGDTECDGTVYFTCSNNLWVSEGEVEGHCGYSTGEDPVDECSIGDTTCDGTEYFICLNGEWDSEGLVDGKCGYTLPDGGDDGTGDGSGTEPSGDSTLEWDKVIFTLGDFEVTLLILVVLAGALLLLLVLK